MERWAANTLRTLGIILMSGFVLIGSMLLLLLSMCASAGGHSDQGAPFALGAVVTMIVGIALVSWFARAIFRSSTIPDPPAVESLFARPYAESREPVPAPEPEPVPRPELSVPLHLSPLGRQSIHHLVLALAAQIGVSAVAWFFNQLRFWTAPRAFAPHNWTLTLIAPYILHQLPYAILIYYLLKRPNRAVFTFAIAVPAVLVLQSLFGLSLIGMYYIHHPLGFLLLAVPWSLHIVILVMAYKTIQQVGLHPYPSSIMAAAAASFFYFLMIQSTTAVLYHYRLR